MAGQRAQEERTLDRYAKKFNALYRRMQTRQSQKAVDDLFGASDVQLNRKASR